MSDNEVKEVELKTEFVGCYIRKSEKELLEALTEYLFLAKYIEKRFTSETMRFALNLCHAFVKNELGQVEGL